MIGGANVAAALITLLVPAPYRFRRKTTVDSVGSSSSNEESGNNMGSIQAGHGVESTAAASVRATPADSEPVRAGTSVVADSPGDKLGWPVLCLIQKQETPPFLRAKNLLEDTDGGSLPPLRMVGCCFVSLSEGDEATHQ